MLLFSARTAADIDATACADHPLVAWSRRRRDALAASCLPRIPRIRIGTKHFLQSL